ncbi:hypothetical protein CRUP_015065 [Coryphaenoides rupestris]|nr:hypothetical protein CRUP_015065 [Coryphaenoides rupestris]
METEVGGVNESQPLPSKVLDIDTISQVKEKLLEQRRVHKALKEQQGGFCAVRRPDDWWIQTQNIREPRWYQSGLHKI